MARLTRQRYKDNGEVKLTVWAFVFTEQRTMDYRVVAYIRRKRHNGGLVYILTDVRDWYVNSYDTLRPAYERASSPKF